jgi:hypothetical protein
MSTTTSAELAHHGASHLDGVADLGGSRSALPAYLKRIGFVRVREVLEGLSMSKKGEVVAFKHKPKKIVRPSIQE